MPATLTAPTADLAATESLSKLVAEKIIEIQQRHHAETGAWLNVAEAFRVLEHDSDPIPEPDEPPTTEDLVRVQCWLHSQGYTPQSLRWAIIDLAKWGTAEFTPWIDDEDRERVEALLHESQWPPVWSSTKVELTDRGLVAAV